MQPSITRWTVVHTNHHKIFNVAANAVADTVAQGRMMLALKSDILRLGTRHNVSQNVRIIDVQNRYGLITLDCPPSFADRIVQMPNVQEVHPI